MQGGTVASAGKLLRFSASGRSDETIEDREVLQPYGFQSRPPDGSEGLVLRQGNWLVLIAADGRETRVALEKGELAVVTDEGDKMLWKRNRKVEIAVGSILKPGQLTIEITGPGSQVDIHAATVRLGGMALESALGIVTGGCICAMTGAAHPVTSLTAKATL
jgi:phage gp45-like